MRDWAAAASLPPANVPGTAEDSFSYWARAIGAAHLHQPEEVRKDVSAIEAIHQKFVSEKKKDFVETTENDLKQAQAWLAFAEASMTMRLTRYVRLPTRKIRWATNRKGFLRAK
jgi:hypothetical protein